MSKRTISKYRSSLQYIKHQFKTNKLIIISLNKIKKAQEYRSELTGKTS
jgi:hypothetical protein